MKIILSAVVLIFLLSSSTLHAESDSQANTSSKSATGADDNALHDSFLEAWNKDNLEEAVLLALNNGSTPEAILHQGIKLSGVNPQNVIRAMYCAGINGEDIEEAALNYGLTEEIVSAGYKKSVDECREILVDSQGFIPSSAPVNFGGTAEPMPPSRPARPGRPTEPPGKPASPSTF